MLIWLKSKALNNMKRTIPTSWYSTSMGPGANAVSRSAQSSIRQFACPVPAQADAQHGPTTTGGFLADKHFSNRDET